MKTIFDLVSSAQQFTSTESTYLKLTAGVHKLRFCPPWKEDELPVRLIIHHSDYKNKDGNLRLPLCYNYVFKTEDIAKVLAFEKKVILQEDVKLFGQYGCIYCKISDILTNSMGKSNNRTYARRAYFLNVVNRADGKVYIWRVGDKVLKDIATYAAAYPNMFDKDKGFDFMVNATGEKLQRRYMITPITDPCPLGVPLDKIHDLDTAMAEGYTNVNTAMELIISSYPQIIPVLGINPAEWVSNLTVPF